MLDHFFPLLFPKDSESLTILDIQLREVGAKRPLNGTLKVKKMREKKLFFARRFQTIFKQKRSYLRPLLSITFPQRFRISKNIEHPISGRGGKKTNKRYLKSKKVREKNLFFVLQFLTIFKQKCSYLRPLLAITFPQGFRISKNIGHPTSGSGGKKGFTLVCTPLPFHLPFSLPYSILLHFLEPIISPFYVSLI